MGTEEIQISQLNLLQVNKDINWYQEKTLEYIEENK